MSSCPPLSRKRQRSAPCKKRIAAPSFGLLLIWLCLGSVTVHPTRLLGPAALAFAFTSVVPYRTLPSPQQQTKTATATITPTPTRNSSSRKHQWAVNAAPKKFDDDSMAKTTTTTRASMERRRSHEEQLDLLRSVCENRRILQVKRDMVSLSSSAPTIPDLQLSRATGYGDNLDDLHDAMDAGDAAREILITSNMGLVYYTVNDILKRRSRKLLSVTRDDLVQEGAIGLARAVDRWNFAAATLPSSAVSNDNDGTSSATTAKFSTYAVYWIRAAVLRGIAERDDLVRVPEHVSAAIAKVSTAAAALGISLDYVSPNHPIDNSAADWKEASAAKALAEAAGITDRQLQEAMKVRQRRNGGILSFDSWMQMGKDYETDGMHHTTASASTAAVDGIDSEHMKQTLSRFLRPREIEAVSWRYGLNNNLVSSEKDTLLSPPPRSNPSLLAKRNYVANAEMNLFGTSDSETTRRIEREGRRQSPQNDYRYNTMPPPVRGKWGEAMSFTEVGNRMQISAEYGRRLCHAALDKLRRAADEGALEAAFLY